MPHLFWYLHAGILLKQNMVLEEIMVWGMTETNCYSLRCRPIKQSVLFGFESACHLLIRSQQELATIKAE